MSQAFILWRQANQTQIFRNAQLQPQSMTEVWYSDATSALPARARALSESGVSLAVLEWESDVLKLWAFKDKALEFEYDSSPSFATCTITAPVTSVEGDLGALFDRPEQSLAIQRLLARKKGLGFISEAQRLRQLLEFLGVQTDAPSAH